LSFFAGENRDGKTEWKPEKEKTDNDHETFALFKNGKKYINL